MFITNDETYKKFQALANGPFYVFDEERFSNNYTAFFKALNADCNNFIPSYSVKTNYLPSALKTLERDGGFVEVVSEMELDLVKKLGYSNDRIILNGPVKTENSIRCAIDCNITINVDSSDDFTFIKKIHQSYMPSKKISLGIRLNYLVLEKISRFGMFVDGPEIRKVLSEVSEIETMQINQVHAHFQERSLDAWRDNIEKFISALSNLKESFSFSPKVFNFGGGLFGPMSGKILQSFQHPPPSYYDYAKLLNQAASRIKTKFGNEIIFHVEPGTSLVADCMEYVANVYAIKHNSEKCICVLNGTIKDIAAHSGRVPTDLLIVKTENRNHNFYSEIELVGNTCLEKDVIIQVNDTSLAVGDLIVFPYCGAYSIVMRPNFIQYMPPIFSMIRCREGDYTPIKIKQSLEEIFQSYSDFNIGN